MSTRTENRRSNPKIYTHGYLVLSRLRRQIIEFAENHVNSFKECIIADIGCGNAPYKAFFKNCKRYIRMDHFESPEIDVQGYIEKIPLKDGYLDFVVCTQVLEHTDNFQKAIDEVHRVLKKGGKAFFSFPFAAFIHGQDDRWRFSLYTIEHVFKQFKILSIQDNGGIMLSFGQFFADFVAAFPLGRFLYPLFLCSNLIAILMNAVVTYLLIPPLRLVFTKKEFEKISFHINHALPSNYSVVVEKIN